MGVFQQRENLLVTSAFLISRREFGLLWLNLVLRLKNLEGITLGCHTIRCDIRSLYSVAKATKALSAGLLFINSSFPIGCPQLMSLSNQSLDSTISSTKSTSPRSRKKTVPPTSASKRTKRTGPLIQLCSLMV